MSEILSRAEIEELCEEWSRVNPETDPHGYEWNKTYIQALQTAVQLAEWLDYEYNCLNRDACEGCIFDAGAEMPCNKVRMTDWLEGSQS